VSLAAAVAGHYPSRTIVPTPPEPPVRAEDPPALSLIGSALPSGLSDPAFRVYVALLLGSGAAWTTCSDAAKSIGRTNHQLRMPLAELVSAGLVARRRRRGRHTPDQRETTLLDYCAIPEGGRR